MSNTTESRGDPIAPPGRSGRRIAALLVVAVLISSAATLWVARTWLYPGALQPVVLDAREQAVLDAKLQSLAGAPEATTDEPRRTAPDAAGGADPAELRPTPYVEHAEDRVLYLSQRELNALIRRELGIEGTGHEFDTLSRKDLTQAERRNAPSYRVGDYVQPEKDYDKTGLRRGELYRVAEIENDNRLLLVGEDGRRHDIDPRRHMQLSVYEKTRSELAPGDWARITRNSPALDVSNGDRVRVIDVKADRVELENDKGRRIELDGSRPLHLEHAYATTVHSAQGLSTDRMMIDLDTRSLTTGKDLYYVAISRARYQATIYTNSRAELPAAISREPVKTAALDIHREREAPHVGRTA